MTSDGFRSRMVGGWRTVRQQAGVTLTELVVVASIIIIFAVSSLPFLGSIIPDLKTRGAAEQVVETLRTARQNAIGTTATYRVIFTSHADPDHLHRRDAGGEHVPREPSAGRHGGGDRRRDPGGDPRGDAVRRQGLDHDGGRQRDRELPERHVLAGRGEHARPRPLVHGDDGMPMTIRRQSGLSLVELMVALLLLGVALMGLAAAFAPGRMAIQQGDQATTATFLARQVLEDMRNRAYDLDSDELVNGATFPATTGYGGITNYPNYRRTITFVNNSPEPGTKTVTVAVIYRNSSGMEQSVTLTTIFTQGS